MSVNITNYYFSFLGFILKLKRQFLLKKIRFSQIQNFHYNFLLIFFFENQQIEIFWKNS